ncbi:dihydrolipoamide acetyltransferase family protein [Tepidanaerobacter syntrophicus]|uniref:Dihydrolipoamide acetyltransferase component of pyruvate dehydrogenase complex n=2 Tax=Tepidanaerobacter syntrophicus TaxID=224999 RepID=A0A0U9HJ46_9FIRM|nr:dihydrolipoamide acetyltransferase family protein [Tepidanaerobacter syntrophicus]GAQ25924.1 pyruvate dehydrogenase E5 component [Tepidanaerobacter syntrophicus]
MAVNVVMPKLGLTMTKGTLNKWLIKVGDKVKKGDAVAEISSEKITNVVEAPADGILGKILVNEGEEVPVATPIGIIISEGEKLDEIPKAAAKEEAVTPPSEGFIKATPIAKKLAKENGLDLSQIQGTGPGGRITEEDVKNYMASKTAGTKEKEEKAEVEKIPMDNMRKIIAQRMKQSWTQAPHVTENIKIDATEMVDFRSKLNMNEKIKITFTDIIVKACAIAIKKYPNINWSTDGEFIIKNKNINIGVAVALENGLIVPVVRDVDKKSLKEISDCIKDLSIRARENRLQPDETIGGTFTVTNLGMYEIDSFTPIINPPESAILGVNRIYQEPAVINDNITIRQSMTLSLSFDHRIIDGAAAAKFLLYLKQVLENPATLAL